jgi:hypothetical protein
MKIALLVIAAVVVAACTGRVLYKDPTRQLEVEFQCSASDHSCKESSPTAAASVSPAESTEESCGLFGWFWKPSCRTAAASSP